MCRVVNTEDIIVSSGATDNDKSGSFFLFADHYPFADGEISNYYDDIKRNCTPPN